MRALFIAMALLMAPGIAWAAPMIDTYTVQPGDSLWKIAVKYRVGLREIIEANPETKARPWLIYPGQKIKVPLVDEGIKAMEGEVLELVNEERAAAGLKPLAMDWELQRVARLKSQDMIDKNYFSHQSPTYGSPFEMIKNFGISYRSAGENIAAGQRSAAEVMESWMKSQGHRANILKPGYTHLGVGYAAGGKWGHIWTQIFISR